MRTPRVLLAAAVIGVVLVGGCSSGGGDEGGDRSDSYVDDSGGAPAAPQKDSGGAAGSGDAANGEAGGGAVDQEAPASGQEGEGEGTGEGEGSQTGDSEANLAAAGHSVVTTATVGVQVEDPWGVIIQIADYATERGGWEEVRHFTWATETTGASGSITVKVPPATMDEALEHLSTYGEVTTIDLQRDDITVRVHDTAARVRAAQMMLDRAEQWLAAATTREEVQEVESIYNERLIALDDLLSQQANETQATAMSTLIVQVFSPEAAPPAPEPEVEPETGFLAGLRSGWDAFYDWGSDALRVLGVLLPWLIFLGLLAVATRYASRPARRRWADRVRPERSSRPTTEVPPAGVEIFQTRAPGGQPAGREPQGPPAPPAPPA